MPHFAKPAEGSWTEHYPELGTGPVDYTDSVDPAHYEAEREAIFKRTWLNVGRVERLPKTGSYFTRELAAAGTSLIIVRGRDGQIRAFHNVCRHRGNKLVWNDFPKEETAGTCRQFTCKYHGWRYALDGENTFIQQEEEFFGIDKSQYGLKAVRCEIWEGFIFVNVDPLAQPLTDYLGDMAKGLEGYPFHEMTEVFSYRAEVGSNWKLFIDAFAEFYHAPVLHQKQAVKDEADKLLGYGYEGLHYELHGPHSMLSSWGGMSPPRDLNMVKPIERVLRSGLFGPWDRPAIDGLDPLPPGVNPAKHKAWGMDSFFFFPNFQMLIWAPGWYLTYHYWPTGVDKHMFECGLYFVPSKTPGERLAKEIAAVTFKEYALQDGNTLEATQMMLASRAVSEFPLNDQEILLRHLHKTAGDYVREYAVLPAEFAALEPFGEWVLPTEPERYAKRLASSMEEMQAFYDAALPLLDQAKAHLDSFPLHELPDAERNLMYLMYSLVMVSFPVEVWKQARVPDSGAAYLDLVVEPRV